MQCPTDGSTLTMSERSGIEIDYCPQCRGVWLDRGELDKIIERSATMQAPAAGPVQSQPQSRHEPSSYERERDERRQQHERRYTDPYQPAQYQQQPYRKKKKESWLSEIFD